jgi:chromosome segregation ATPase
MAACALVVLSCSFVRRASFVGHKVEAAAHGRARLVVGQAVEDSTEETTYISPIEKEHVELDGRIAALGEPETEREGNQHGMILHLVRRLKLEETLSGAEEEYISAVEFGNGASAWGEFQVAKMDMEEELEEIRAKEVEAAAAVKELDALKAELANGRDTIVRASEVLSSTRTECAALDDELLTTGTQLQAIEDEQHACAQRLALLPDEIAAAKHAIVTSEAEAADGRASMATEEAALDALREHAAIAKAQADEAVEAVVVRVAAAADLRVTVEGLEATTASQRAELVQVEASVAELEARVKSAISDEETLPARIAEAKRADEACIEKLAAVDEEMASDRLELTHASAALEAARSECNEAKAKAEATRDELSRAVMLRRQLDEQRAKHAQQAEVEEAAATAILEDVASLELDLEALRERRATAAASLAQAEETAMGFESSPSGQLLSSRRVGTEGDELDAKLALSSRAIELMAQEAEGQLDVLSTYQSHVQAALDGAAAQRAAAQEQLDALAVAQVMRAHDAMAEPWLVIVDGRRRATLEHSTRLPSHDLPMTCSCVTAVPSAMPHDGRRRAGGCTATTTRLPRHDLT